MNLRQPHQRQHAAVTIVAALDIGTSKICCAIAALADEPAAGCPSPGERLKLLGFGHQKSAGIEAGEVVDFAHARAAVAAAISQAEQLARARIDTVHVAFNGGQQSSTTFDGYVDLQHGLVCDADLEALDTGAHDFASRSGRKVMAMNRIAYRLDDATGGGIVHEPRGMPGQRLFANFHAVTVNAAALSRVSELVESCHLEVSSLQPAGYASAIAATTQDERLFGVICIDIGCAVTTIAAFADGHFVLADVIALGGQQITTEIARALSNPLAEAERIKTLYGNVEQSPSDEHEFVPYSLSASPASGGQWTSRLQVSGVVQQQLALSLQAVRRRLGVASFRGNAGQHRFVLTGGTSNLAGIAGFASSVLAAPVRVAQPLPMTMTGARSGGIGPEFSCVFGLLYAVGEPVPGAVRAPGGGSSTGYLSRVERWLRASF